MKKIFACVKF